MARGTLLGRNPHTGRNVRVTEEARATHMFVPGRTGTGKSTFLEFLIRQDIRNGRGVCLLDPHGDIYRKTLAYIAARRHGGLWDKTYLIDPNEDDYRVGLNYLDIPGTGEDKRVGLVMEGFYKVMGHGTAEAKPLLERWANAAIKPLIAAGLTLAELYPFLTDPSFRQSVLKHTQDPFTLAEWQYFEMELQNPRDRNLELLAVLNRASKFARDQRMRQIVGQANSVDWERVLNERGVALVNLLPGSNVSREQSRMLGIIIIHQLINAAKHRPKGDYQKRFYLYVDEFSLIASDDFREALTGLRGFGVSVILAQQDLHDLMIEDEGKLYSSVMNNTTIKVVFGMEDAEEARKLADTIFVGQISGDKRKYEMTDQAFAPVSKSATVQDVTTGSSQVSGGSQAYGSSEGRSYSDSGDELVTTKGISFSDTSSRSETFTTSVTTREQRWTEYEEYLVERTPVFWSLDEDLHRYTKRICRQTVGEAQLKYHPKKPTVSIKTIPPGKRPFAKVRVSREEIAAFKGHVYERMKALSPAQVDRLILERQERIRGVLTAPEEYEGEPVTPAGRRKLAAKKRKSARTKYKVKKRGSERP
jgi:hypothetical protein